MHNYNILNRYVNKTRIGNWSEEWELEETKMKDYLKAKEQGTLSTSKKEQNIAVSLDKASLTYQADGLIHFGDHFMLFNEKVESYLACDLSERIGGSEESYAVTAASNLQPCNRGVFIIKKYEKEQDLFQDDKLHYGQKFRIQVNPKYSQKDLYLTSLQASPQRCAKFSRHQEVSVSIKENIDTVWVCEHADPKVRFESANQEIRQGEPLLIKHVLTSQWLASDKVIYKNQFGQEFEVFGHSFQHHNKTQVLTAEKGGRTTIDIPSRNQNAQNVWIILTAQNQNQQFQE